MARHHIGYILPVMLVIIGLAGFYYGLLYDVFYNLCYDMAISTGVPAENMDIIRLFWYFLPVPLTIALLPFVLSNAMKEEPL